MTEGLSWYAGVKLLHVLSAVWLLTGLLARPVVLAAARRAPDMRILKALADVSGRLEELMIAPGLGLVLATGIATALVGGVPLFGPFVGGPLWLFVSLLIMVAAVVLTPRTLGDDRRWGQALEEAASAGVVTDRLRPFLLRDAMIRRYAPDIVSVLVIVALMVTKPF
ncbi:MAG TPA: DUF2269 family protein [Candidatus Limnocylindria bacterium]